MLQVQIYIDKDELKGSQLLHEFILQLLVNRNIAGATAFHGQIGFGERHYLKKPNELLRFDETPMMITFIDEDKKVKSVLTELRKVWKGGFIVTHKVKQWNK